MFEVLYFFIQTFLKLTNQKTNQEIIFVADAASNKFDLVRIQTFFVQSIYKSKKKSEYKSVSFFFGCRILVTVPVNLGTSLESTAWS